MPLNIIPGEYRAAEITCLFLHEKKSDKKINLFSIFELVPFEQQSSFPIGDQSTSWLRRENVNDRLTLYITRIVDQDCSNVVSKFENAHNGFRLIYENLDATIEVPQKVVSEPPDDNPLIITGKSERTIGRILPNRNTAFRVWSRLNVNKEWLGDFDSKLFEKITKLSREYLGYDLAAVREQLGNIYLCACNSVLRSWEVTLLDLNKELLLSFYERENKTIKGCRIVIEEERAKNKGFIISKDLESNREKIDLPYFPDALHKKLFDQRGNLIDYSFGTWANMDLTINVQENVVNLKVLTKDGEEIFSIPKTSQASRMTIGSFDHSVTHYLTNALRERKFEELEASREFVFFPPEENSLVKAKSVVRELLNTARNRCIILDPYFGAPDLQFAVTVQNISIPIQIISSSMFLGTRDRANERTNLFKKTIALLRSISRKKTHGLHAHMLLDAIEQYRILYPVQKIECKVLKGQKSLLHDRYIVVDDKVYLLGSSLNEFGARATTIIKVPTPERMIEQALSWWNDTSQICVDLKDFVTQKNQTKR